MGLARYEFKEEDMGILLQNEKRFKSSVLPNQSYRNVINSNRSNSTVNQNSISFNNKPENKKVNNTVSVYSGKYANEINKAATEFGIDSFLLASVIRAESGFDPSVKSPVGAIGLTQLMPGTAKDMGVNPYDTYDNIRGGAKYLSQMLKSFGGNYQQALAAYNAGPGTVNDWLRGTNKSGRNKGLKRSVNGIPNFKETRQYIPRVLEYYNEFKSKASEISKIEVMRWCSECVTDYLTDPVGLVHNKKYCVVDGTTKKIVDGRATLPTNIFRLEGVYNENNSLIRDFMYQGDYLIFPDDKMPQKVFIDYYSLALDDTTGFPLIKKGYEPACYAYCVYKMYEDDATCIPPKVAQWRWLQICQDKEYEIEAAHRSWDGLTDNDIMEIHNYIISPDYMEIVYGRSGNMLTGLNESSETLN